MTTDPQPIPVGGYGVLIQDNPASELDEVAEQVRRIGYAILDSGYITDDLTQLPEAFNRTRSVYAQKYGEARLRKANEFHTVRAPLAHGDSVFVRLASNHNLLNVLGKLIVGKYILNQQNGVTRLVKPTTRGHGIAICPISTIFPTPLWLLTRFFV